MRIPFLSTMLERARLEGAREMAQAVRAAQDGEASRPAPAYLYENPWLFRPLQSPKRKALQVLGADDLRRLANAFDVLRLPIEHLKREALAVRWRIVPREKGESSERALARCRRAEEFFATTGGNGEFGKPRSRFERMLLDDVLVLGAFAVARSYDASGKLVQQTAFDAATVQIRVDERGWPDPNHPYQQWALGRPIGDPLSSDEVYYAGLHPSTSSPYYTSPIEWILAPIAGAMAADEWNRSFFEGDHPGGWAVKFDPSLRPEQVSQFMGYIREALSGDTVAKRSLLPLPAGAEVVTEGARKDQDFDSFQQFMLRRVLAIYGVTASSVGFAGEQYKVSQEGSNAQTSRFGVQPLLDLLKELYDDTLERLGFGDLEAVEAGDDESIRELAPVVSSLVNAGILTKNEGRKRLGYEPVEGGEGFADEETEAGDSDDETLEVFNFGDADLGSGDPFAQRAYNPNQPRGPHGRWIPTISGEEAPFAHLSMSERRKAIEGHLKGDVKGFHFNEAMKVGFFVSGMLASKASSKGAGPWRANAIFNLPELLKKAKLVNSHPDRDSDPNLKEIHRLWVNLKVGEETSRVKITVKEYTLPDPNAEGATHKVYHLESVDRF